MQFPQYKREKEIYETLGVIVAGCDEVGVSPLAGPVVAAVCVLNPETIGEKRSKHKWYYRVRDSKTTNEEERQILVATIKEHALAYGIGAAEPTEIDSLNIHHATLLAMRRALDGMLETLRHETKKIHLLIDGRFKIPGTQENSEYEISQETIVAGDAKILSISAASIIAKVHRDNIMRDLHEKFPDYGFDKHKGYNTKAHREAIARNGICEFHRKSFLKNF